MIYVVRLGRLIALEGRRMEWPGLIGACLDKSLQIKEDRLRSGNGLCDIGCLAGNLMAGKFDADQ